MLQLSTSTSRACARTRASATRVRACSTCAAFCARCSRVRWSSRGRVTPTSTCMRLRVSDSSSSAASSASAVLRSSSRVMKPRFSSGSSCACSSLRRATRFSAACSRACRLFHRQRAFPFGGGRRRRVGLLAVDRRPAAGRLRPVGRPAGPARARRQRGRVQPGDQVAFLHHRAFSDQGDELGVAPDERGPVGHHLDRLQRPGDRQSRRQRSLAHGREQFGRAADAVAPGSNREEQEDRQPPPAATNRQWRRTSRGSRFTAALPARCRRAGGPSPAGGVEDAHRRPELELLHRRLGQGGDPAAFGREQLALGGDEIEVVRQAAIVAELRDLDFLPAQVDAGLRRRRPRAPGDPAGALRGGLPP